MEEGKDKRGGEAPTEGREPKRSEGDRTGGGAVGGNGKAADPEVPATAKRRQFGREYKLRIVQEADRCTAPGEIGALIRREGLHSSHLAGWRKARDRGELGGKVTPRRGPKPDPDQALAKENEKLKKKIARLEEKLGHAELIIDVQKKVSKMMGITLKKPEDLEDED